MAALISSSTLFGSENLFRRSWDFPADVGFVGEAERVVVGVVVDVEGVVLDGPYCFPDDVLVIVFRGHHGLDHFGGR